MKNLDFCTADYMPQKGPQFLCKIVFYFSNFKLGGGALSALDDLLWISVHNFFYILCIVF